MKGLIFLLVVLLFCSCDRHRSSHSIPYSEKERLADEVLASTAIKLHEERGLIFAGTGAGMLGPINMLALSFDYRKQIPIEKGRELLITGIQALLSNINSNESIRPYLRNYPFEPTNVGIIIFFRNSDGSGLGEDALRVVAATEGMLRYYIEPEKNCAQFKAIHEESYEEALLKLESPKQVGAEGTQ